MNINNLFFHILYCNYRYFNDPKRNWSKLVRTLQSLREVHDAEDPLCFLSVHFNYAKVSMNEENWGISGDVDSLHLQAVSGVKTSNRSEDECRRRRGIDTIVLCGISTSIGVDTTAREAYQLGYREDSVEW